MQNISKQGASCNKQDVGCRRRPGQASIPPREIAKFAWLELDWGWLAGCLARRGEDWCLSVRSSQGRAGPTPGRARCNLCFGSQAGTKLGATSCGGQGPQQVPLVVVVVVARVQLPVMTPPVSLLAGVKGAGGGGAD